jgi:hypothetical protein
MLKALSIYGHADFFQFKKIITGAMKQAVRSLLTKQLVILFNTKCASCHATDLMTDDALETTD